MIDSQMAAAITAGTTIFGISTIFGIRCDAVEQIYLAGGGPPIAVNLQTFKVRKSVDGAIFILYSNGKWLVGRLASIVAVGSREEPSPESESQE